MNNFSIVTYNAFAIDNERTMPAQHWFKVRAQALWEFSENRHENMQLRM